MSLSVSDIVSFTTLVAAQSPTAQGFGTGLVVGSNSLPLEERIRTYTGIAGVAVDFATSTQEYLAAQAYFGQTPAPAFLKIGNRYASAQAGRLRGAPVSSVLATYTGITNGGFDVSIDGTNRTIILVDLSGAASMAAVAAILQTRLQVALASTLCTWDPVGLKFVITSPTTGTSSLVGYAVAPTGGSGTTDASTILGFTAAAGALTVPGIALETLTASLGASQVFDPDFSDLTLVDASTQDIKDAMAWAEAASPKVIFWYTTSDANAKLSAATSDLFYYAKNLGYVRSVGQFSSSPYGVVSAMARLDIVDYNQPNSTITLEFKQEPGIAIEVLTETERLALLGKNANFYTSFGGFAMIDGGGKTASGRFVDEVRGLDWFEATSKNAIFGKLATSVTKIPQTDAGVAKLVQAEELVCNQAVANGLFAPGVWLGANLGEVKTGDFLSTGFYVYAQSVASQSSADRALRKSPPITVIACGAGAIHSVAVTAIFQR